jgi:CBS domain containing-hemolysin-like protein
MTWLVILAIVIVGLMLSAMYSGAETGFYCVSRLRLHLAARQKEPGALRLAHALEDRQEAVGMTLVGTNVANYVTTTAVAFVFAELLGLGEADTEVYTVLLLTPIVFVFGEVVPKTLFQRFPYALLTRCSVPLAVTLSLLRITGILWCHQKLIALVRRIVGAEPTFHDTFDPKQRMALLLQEALAGQSLGDDRSYLIDQVIQLSETPLHAVMIPRNKVTTAPTNADRRELTRIARRTSHLKLPVYDTGPRHIIGLVTIDELLWSQDWESVGERMQPAMAISPHVTVAAAMSEMQGAGRDMAIVTDRGGQMLGVVTLKDLIDAVLGELGGSD